jgi:hypothetical protein
VTWNLVAGHKEHVPWTKLSSGLDVITSSGLFMAFLRTSLRFVAPNSVPHSSRFFNRGEIEIGGAEYFPTSRGQILHYAFDNRTSMCASEQSCVQKVTVLI